MNPVKILISSFVLITISSVAVAGRYDQNDIYAQVVNVQPVYENYQVPQNRRVCDNNFTARSDNRQYSNNGGGAILGGIIGGIIGNRFGKGNGRRAATAAGVIAGAAIGSSAQPKGYYDNNNGYNNRSSKQCYKRKEYRQEQRLVGYDVDYDYNGQIYQARLQNHPGNRVRIQVNVQVAEY